MREMMAGTAQRILILTQYFHPDISAVGQIATELAEDIVASGSSVTALAARGSYLGGGLLSTRGEHNGVNIVRSLATSFGKRTIVHRAFDYASFYLTATWTLLRVPRNDVIIATTTPPLISAAALLAKWLKGSMLVYWVQDLYPEVAVAFGVLRPRSAVTRIMRLVSRTVMNRTDRVVVLGEEMRRRCVEAGARSERVVVIPNWSDENTVRPIPHACNPLRAEAAGKARTLVMYAGNMGRGHDVETLLSSVRLLESRQDIGFLFVGDGAKRALVELAVSELPNVRLGMYQARERLGASLSAADLHLIALSPESEGLIEPSKLYGIMAAGRPVIYVGPSRSEVATTIEREKCGLVIRNGDAKALATAILHLADDESERLAMGQRAREALVERYSRRVAAERFRKLLRELANAESLRPTAGIT